MDTMISYCGLTCTECPAFIATVNDDAEARKKIAADWSKQFNANINPDDICCKGCLNDSGRIFHYCSVCEIRKCGRERKLSNCSVCTDYACAKLDEFFTMVPHAREKLDAMRKG